MDDAVFVDTCIWASFFDKRNSPEKNAVIDLIDRDRVTLIGPVVTEILLGFRRIDQAHWVYSRLRETCYVELGKEDWRMAATLGRKLAARGHKLPLTDLAIATIAIQLDASVYSSDPHFDLIPNLKRYRPS